jgi:hypothetical protein
MDELVIKVPAPFSGMDDVGFSARYPAQESGEPLRDIPVFVEGPARPMRVLMERLLLFADRTDMIDAGAADEAYCWTPPIQLSDEVCVLAFRDRSLVDPVSAPLASRSYVWNLVRPLAFPFLRDCVRIGKLRLADRIAVVLDTGRPPVVDLELERRAITPINGELLLFGS